MAIPKRPNSGPKKMPPLKEEKPNIRETQIWKDYYNRLSPAASKKAGVSHEDYCKNIDAIVEQALANEDFYAFADKCYQAYLVEQAEIEERDAKRKRKRSKRGSAK